MEILKNLHYNSVVFNLKMLKKIILISGSVLIGIILIIVGFLAWASARNMSDEDYQKGILLTFDQPLPEAKTDIVLATWNIGFGYDFSVNGISFADKEHYEQNMNKIKNLLQQINPDILAVQEADINSARSYEDNQPLLLSEAMNANMSAFLPTWSKNYILYPSVFNPSKQYGKINSGSALISKYSILEQTRYDLNQPKSMGIKNIQYMTRAIQKIKLNINGKELIILNLHLDSSDKENRKEQAEKVVEIFRELDKGGAAVIITGDFNCPPSYASQLSDFPIYMQSDFIGDGTYNVFFNEPGLSSVISKDEYLTNEKDFLTYPSGRELMQIDHVFYNGKIKKISAEVIKGENGSDHNPVVFTFRFN